MPADIKQQKPPGAVSVMLAEHFWASAGVIAFALLALGYLFLFAPALRKLNAANKTQLLTQEITAKQAYLANLQTLKANYEKIPADDVQKIRAMIPFADDLPGLTAVFEALAKENDVSLDSIGFSGGLGDNGGPVPGNVAVSEDGGLAGLQAITISLTLGNADYQRLKLFIEAIERHLRLFDITTMSLNPGQAQYVMTLKTYVHPPLAH